MTTSTGPGPAPGPQPTLTESATRLADVLQAALDAFWEAGQPLCESLSGESPDLTPRIEAAITAALAAAQKPGA
jgi:hypothetical protein